MTEKKRGATYRSGEKIANGNSTGKDRTKIEIFRILATVNDTELLKNKKKAEADQRLPFAMRTLSGILVKGKEVLAFEYAKE